MTQDKCIKSLTCSVFLRFAYIKRHQQITQDLDHRLHNSFHRWGGGEAGNVQSGRSFSVCVCVCVKWSEAALLKQPCYCPPAGKERWSHIAPHCPERLGRAESWLMDKGDLVPSWLAAADRAMEIERIAKEQRYKQAQWSDSDLTSEWSDGRNERNTSELPKNLRHSSGTEVIPIPVMLDGPSALNWDCFQVLCL